MEKKDIGKYITSNSAIFPEDAEFMFDTISKLPNKGNLLEIGTGYGHSAVFFSQLKPNWTVYTIDGYGQYGNYPQYFSFGEFDVQGFLQTKGYIEGKGAGNVVQIIGDSQQIQWSYPVDVLFIDADHTFEGVAGDFAHYSQFAKVIFCHDYDLDMAGNDINKFIETLGDEWEVTSHHHTAKIVRK